MKDSLQKRPVLGLDIGGTALKLALVSQEGCLLEKEEHPLAFDGYKTPIVESVMRAAEACLKRVQGSESEPCGIAISATGQIDSRRGLVAGTCGNFPDWAGVKLAERFGSAFGLPVTAANDANCMVMGEAWLGAAKGAENVLGITLGTGVGGGIISGGRLLEGSRGLAGELGHFPLYAGGRACTCGLPGCYEQYASVTALMRALHESGFSFRNARELCADLLEKGIERAPEHPAYKIFEHWRRDAALGLAGLVHIFNPELIVIGGGISAQEELVIEGLRRELFSLLMPEFAKNLSLKRAALGNDAGILGAVRYFLSR